MFGFHESHRSHIHHILFSDLTKIFLFRSILSFSHAMVFVFVPIFLLEIGSTIVHVLFYSIIMYSTVLLTDPIAISIIRKIGFKWTLACSVPFSFLALLCIQYVSTSFYFLLIAGALMGVYQSLFYTALNAEIATKGHNQTRGNEIGDMNILVSFAVTLSPLIGGLIMQHFGYTQLLMFSLIVGIIAIIPLIDTKDMTINTYTFSYRDYIRLFKIKDRASKIFYLNEGGDVVLYQYIWPIALFFLVGNTFSNLGFILTLSALVSITIIYFLKSKLDSGSKQTYLKFTAKGIGFEYFLKVLSFLTFSFFIYIVEIISKLNRKIFDITNQSIFFNNADSSNYLDYILLCDMYGRIGRVLFALFLIPIFLYFGESQETIFGVLLFGLVFSYGLHFLKEVE